MDKKNYICLKGFQIFSIALLLKVSNTDQILVPPLLRRLATGLQKEQ